MTEDEVQRHRYWWRRMPVSGDERLIYREVVEEAMSRITVAELEAE